MKRFFFFSLTLLALTAISGCSKSSDPSPQPYVAQANNLSGSLDGSAISFISGTFITDNTAGRIQLIFYTKADLTEYITLNLPLTIVAGTYTLNSNGLEYAGMLASDGDYESTSGTLQIIGHDQTHHVITGTFEANMVPTPTSTATSTHSITNAQFVLNYY